MAIIKIELTTPEGTLIFERDPLDVSHKEVEWIADVMKNRIMYAFMAHLLTEKEKK